MPIKNHTPILGHKKYKFQYHPITRVLAFIFAFAAIGGAYLYGSKAANSLPYISSATISYSISNDVSKNGTINYGDDLSINITNINLGNVGNKQSYDNDVEVICRNTNSADTLMGSAIKNKIITSNDAIYGTLHLPTNNESNWTNRLDSTCYILLHVVEKNANWDAWWPTKPTDIGSTLPQSDSVFKIYAN